MCTRRAIAPVSLRWLRSLCTRKRVVDSTLRCRLMNFCDRREGDQFALSRLNAFRDQQTLVLDHVRSLRQSGIGSSGLPAVFYARYYAYHGLLMHDGTSTAENGNTVRDLVRRYPPNHRFKQAIAEELQDCCGLPEEELAARNTYLDILKRVFGAPELAQQFFDAEIAAARRLDKARDTDERDRFASLNLDTLHYVRLSLESDIVCLDNTHARMKDAIANKKWITYLLAALGVYTSVELSNCAAKKNTVSIKKPLS